MPVFISANDKMQFKLKTSCKKMNFCWFFFFLSDMLVLDSTSNNAWRPSKKTTACCLLQNDHAARCSDMKAILFLILKKHHSYLMSESEVINQGCHLLLLQLIIERAHQMYRGKRMIESEKSFMIFTNRPLTVWSLSIILRRLLETSHCFGIYSSPILP